MPSVKRKRDWVDTLVDSGMLGHKPRTTGKRKKQECSHGNTGYCDDCVSEAEYLRCETRKLKAKKKVRA